ncbi:MAG TPA: caspase family protein [Saprospiraceae bacterium]|nr:caspase family protein [Saprospiraceae bacterium]HND86885.1 caspase family protein [Saprospiraceae bacterium]
MRRILFPLLLIFICPVPSALSAQPSYDLKVKWDNVYPDHAPEVMHDFIMLDDGRVAVVGTIQTDKRTDGFFALFEAGTFRRIMHLTFGGPGNDALTGVAYGGDFNFYAVGYRETPDKGLQAWAIVIDEETGKGTEKQIGGPEDEQFHKIIWLPEEGHGLIAGTRSSQEGYVWLSQIDGTQINPIDNSVGDGIIGEVVGMEKSPDGAWIGGYTRKVKNYTRSGDVWVIKVNADGMLSESIRRISARPGQELLGLTGTIDGELYLSGKIGNANGDSDVWLAEIRPGERDFRTLSFGSDVQDVATSLFRTPGHFKWLVVRKPKALTVQVYSDTINHNYAAYEVVRNEDFHVNRIINIGDNLYLLAGTSYAASRNDGRLRMLCLHANETIKIKDPPEVTVQKIIFDDNNNGILQPGETGALRFTLKNTSRTVPILKGSIKVALVSAPVPGATVSQASLNLGELPIGAERTYSVPAKGSPSLQSGKILLEFTVNANDRETRVFQATIVAEREAPAQPSPGGSQADISITEPDLSQRNSRVVIATEAQAPVTVRAFSGNQNLKSTDFKTRVNGQIRQDDKSPVSMTMQKTNRPNRFEYIFRKEITLERGRNVVYFELEGERTDSIIFEFTPEKPNLHLVVVGVPQTDLSYTVKDARDFAAAMIGQRGVGFFNEVFVDTLMSRERTKAAEISKTLGRLKKAYADKLIKRNDYVVVFMSSHGMVRKSDSAFGLMASDYEEAIEEETTVSYQAMVENYLNHILCKKVIFIDACHSGASDISSAPVAGEKDGSDKLKLLEERIRYANDITNGAVSFFSCKGTQSSYEDVSWQNGAFTKALLEAFADKACSTPAGMLRADVGEPGMGNESKADDHFLSLGELEAFLQKRVPQLVRQKSPMLQQNPQFRIHPPMTRDLTFFQILR